MDGLTKRQAKSLLAFLFVNPSLCLLLHLPYLPCQHEKLKQLEPSNLTPGRGQLKTLSLPTNIDQKSLETEFWIGDKWQ